jgi:hypothetical protein
MMIDCDKSMVAHLLRNWHPNRLRPQNVPLAKARPRLIKMQNGICPVCLGPPLVDDGKATHFDHVVTVKEFTDKVFHGELTFDEAYCRLWDDSNLRAVHAKCNYDRRDERKLASKKRV